MTGQMELAREVLDMLLDLVGDCEVEYLQPVDLVDTLASVGLRLTADGTGESAAAYYDALKAGA